MKNDIKKKLDWLAQASKFNIRKTSDGHYEVEFSDDTKNLVALIYNDGNIVYCVTGVYNSGCDWADIDIDALLELKSYCEGLIN